MEQSNNRSKRWAISASSAVKKRRSRMIEKISFWIFRLTTYFVIACAGYIFLDIAIKGSRTVFKTTPPFVNLEFLTQPPQTLYVFDYEGKKWTLSDRQFRELESCASRRGSGSEQHRLLRRRHLAVHRRHRIACHWLNGHRLHHRH